MNKNKIRLIAGLVLAFFGASAALADSIKIGLITTLSTGGGYLGQDVRDGFLLAIKEEGGKLGGAAVEVLVEDDGRKPETGRAIAESFLDQSGIAVATCKVSGLQCHADARQASDLVLGSIQEQQKRQPGQPEACFAPPS